MVGFIDQYTAKTVHSISKYRKEIMHSYERNTHFVMTTVNVHPPAAKTGNGTASFPANLADEI